ncbi:Type cbb3 cytochrome oxidase biogenesis protein CcoI; Copper-translocating P-type ATPase [hydrothermal vent metagenome]|uniref:Type cbb3 cytochrome oxidase biogenesis protein CcoI Copper-translocating P-type ATPase n=1 Tax=hydrothermal vent metagenome TaxID=652676 RepID=A0A3B0WC88_9ZZZZ
MSCCAPGAELSAEQINTPESDDETLFAVSRDLGENIRQLELAVPDVNCAACIAKIEKTLNKLEMVTEARVNFSTKRVRVKFITGKARPSEITRAIIKSGYRTFLLDPEADSKGDKTLSELVRALAVAGFAAGNIMLFSISIWSGAEPVTRDLFHWISALIAIPAVAYSGRPFYHSAFRALKVGTLNMDVPISLAVVLALLMSIYETLNSSQEAYFDAAVSLLFFLLIGRTLDYLMREKARGAVRNLARLAPKSVMEIKQDGKRELINVSDVKLGMILEIAAGERIPVDGEITAGISDVDLSLVTGESVPEQVKKGSLLFAGSANLSGVISMRATKIAADSFLARMVSLMEAAEGSKTGYKRIADRAATIYAPLVHLLSLGTFLGWGFITGDWHLATLNAIAVLIITCPCALALAVPIAHVVAAGRLFEAGIMMRDGAALERLAEINRIAFDKTGTLTNGTPVLDKQIMGSAALKKKAASLAATSRHPFSIALSKSAGAIAPIEGAREVPGLGVEAELNDGVWRLGRAEFCNAQDIKAPKNASNVWLSHNGEPVAGFSFNDEKREEAQQIIQRLKNNNVPLVLLSGDREGAVKTLAKEVGIDDARFGLTPKDKLDILLGFSKQGDKVLMVGDGMNDAPALRVAHVSMAPSSAADIGRNAADFIYTRDALDAIPFAMHIARRTSRTVLQNFSLAIAYNSVAVPLAVMGHVTPLFAALAMSSSSVLVTLNSLRLRFGGKDILLKKAAKPHIETNNEKIQKISTNSKMPA